MSRYNPKEIEQKWQQTWADLDLYAAQDFDKRPKYVVLTEFPYPSGSGMHVGHIREYTLGDILARHKRMQGFNVLFPMGYDAFGLPTENFAIKNKMSPQKATEDNTAAFTQQLQRMGFSFDWSRSFKTSDPDYYKWTQWLFLQFFEKGLAYQAEIAINWCPFEKTGLSNEEVVNGRHERCGTLVEKKLLKQWLMRITDYADRLIDGLQTVDYPSRIADQQINWIGRSKGAEINFASDSEMVKVFTTRPDTIFGVSFLVLAPEHPLVSRLTTADQKAAVDSYIKTTQSKSDVERQDTAREKTGAFTGAYATNPINDQKVPIWTADYVLSGYGTGAIMAVPAHDERDYDFARKFDLAVLPVISPNINDIVAEADDRPTAIAIAHDPKTDTYCLLNWRQDPARHEMNGLEWPGGGVDEGETAEQAVIREFREETGYTDVTIKSVLPVMPTIYFSYKANGKAYPKRAIKSVFLLELHSPQQATERHQEEYEKDAYDVMWLTRAEIEQASNMYALDRLVFNHMLEDSVYLKNGQLINSGAYNGLSNIEAKDKIVSDLAAKDQAQEKINYRLRDWVFSRQHYWGEPIPIIHCPEHGAVAVPVDQLPVTLPEVTAYEPTDTGESPLAAITDWVNTTCPQCGQPAQRETDTMPNWAGSSWYYLRYFDAHNNQEFAARDKLDYWQNVDLYLGGMEHTTLHLLYSRFWHEFLYDQGLVPTPEPYAARRGQGIVLAADGTKMSKSKGNVVNPSDVIDSGYGADALRLSIAFLAPYDQTTPWSPEGVAGTYRYLNRLWNLTQEYLAEAPQDVATKPHKEVLHVIHKAIKTVSEDLQSLGFNTAIATLMGSLNELYKLKEIGFADNASWKFAIESMLQLTAPFAPHICDDLWMQLGYQESIHIAVWPGFEERYLTSDTAKMAVQVNGKLRGEIIVDKAAPEAEVIAAAQALAGVQAQLGSQEIKKTILIGGRLINFVV